MCIRMFVLISKALVLFLMKWLLPLKWILPCCAWLQLREILHRLHPPQTLIFLL